MGYKVKKIYVGTQQVRPERNHEYNINFKDYSNISQVQALGWSFYSADSSIVTNAVNQTYGFYNSNYNNNVWRGEGVYPIGISLSNAKKIVLEMTGYGPSSINNAGHLSLGLSKGLSGFDTSGLYWRLQFRGNADDDITLQNDNAQNVWREVVGNASAYSGETTLTLEVDFVNKIVKCTSTGKVKTGTHSLSDSDIAYIKTLTHIEVVYNAYNASKVNNQVWSASIKVK